MKELTSNAKNCIDNYMQKVRSRLKGAKSLAGDDIERDIQDHIERGIEHEAEPVGYDVVAGMLERLGGPEQWVPDEELSWWRRIVSRMQNGPDDWRLSYICIGVFAIGMLSPTFWVFFFLPLSAYIARSAISNAGGGDELWAQKKFLYPPLITFYWIAGLALFFGPPAMLRDLARDSEYYKDFRDIFFALGGLWWCIVSGFIQRKQLLEKAIYPFANDARRKDLKGMFRLGMVCLILGGFVIMPEIIEYMSEIIEKL
jgi:hypothetical protein